MRFETDPLRNRFTREPDWQVQLALDLIESDETVRNARETRALADLVNLLGRVARGKSLLDMPKKLRDLAAACVIHQETKFKFLKLELQCKILAGQEPRSICDQLGLPPKVLKRYEQIFFNVRDCLDSEPYIHSVVLKTGPGCEPSEVESFMLTQAYTGGLSILEPLLVAHRTLHPVYCIVMMRHVGLTVAANSTLQSTYRLLASSPVVKNASSILSSFSVYFEDLFPPPGPEDGNGQKSSGENQNDWIRAVG